MFSQAGRLDAPEYCVTGAPWGCAMKKSQSTGAHPNTSGLLGSLALFHPPAISTSLGLEEGAGFLHIRVGRGWGGDGGSCRPVLQA